jgi:hypothetical protein
LLITPHNAPLSNAAVLLQLLHHRESAGDGAFLSADCGVFSFPYAA